MLGLLIPLISWIPYLAALVCAGALIEYAPLPCLWVAAMVTFVCAWSFRRARTTAAKMVWLNIGVAVAFLGVYESHLTFRYQPVVAFDESGGYRGNQYFQPHDVLGYGSKASAHIAVSRTVDGEIVYDVENTIDETGLRISPPVRSDGRTRGCVWFFGGSYTFGEGVEDDETMPWRVGSKTQGDYVVRNFGFHGYGPHQMLAELQSGLTQERAGCEPTHVVYQAIIWHAQRAVGLAVWDKNGPRYLLDESQRLQRVGSFADIEWGGPPEWLSVRLGRSRIYLEHLEKYVNPKKRAIGNADMRLMVAIVAESAREVYRRFPRASFDVLLWEVYEHPLIDAANRAFAETHLSVHPVSEVLPNYIAERYTFHEHETHPNARAHDEIADYVVREILNR